MASFVRRNNHFKPSWSMSLITLFCMLLFIRLGLWQLQRANEKKQILAMHQLYESSSSSVWQPGSNAPKQFQKISVQGTYLPSVLLLDNQLYHHQFGYHVLSLLALDKGQILLIDRGWIAGDMTRHTLPEIKVPTGSRWIEGSVYYPSEKSWLLGPLIEKQQNNRMVVELIDIKAISQFLHKSIYPFIMRLGTQDAHGFVRDWPIVAMPPQRHYAYAIQWFAFALISLILFIVLNIKKNHETNSI